MNELIIKQQQQQRWKHLKTFDATKVDTKRFQLEFLACDYYWEPLWLLQIYKNSNVV